MACGWSPCTPKHSSCKVTGKRLAADSTHSLPLNRHPVSLQQPAIGQTDRMLLGDAFYGIQGQTQSPGELPV